MKLNGICRSLRVANYRMMGKILGFIFCLLMTTPYIYSQSGTVTDVDGNVYRTIRIGGQVWMAENLNATRYNDGTTINHVPDNATWSDMDSGAWCWYSNDAKYEKPYGKLYNWHAISKGDICPQGWHIPTETDIGNTSEWKTLIFQLGGPDIAGRRLKERGTAHWLAPNIGARNDTGFNGVPGGSRRADGAFDGVRFEGLYWTTMELNVLEYSWARSRILLYDSTRIDYFDGDKRMGLSVRCVKD